MTAIYPLTTAGGTVGPLFLLDPLPCAPSAVASRMYVDSVVATSATVTEVQALREEVRELREAIAALRSEKNAG